MSLAFITMSAFWYSCAGTEPEWKLVWQDEFDGPDLNLDDWEFDLGTGAPIYPDFGIASQEFAPKGIPNDQFSAVWVGYVLADYTANYTFSVIADDGVRLWVDDQLIIDKWIPQAPTEWQGSINLTKGEKHFIKLAYFEDSGWETLILGWECEHFTKSLVPTSHLTTPGNKPGLFGNYFDNKELIKNDGTKTRIDSEINWATGTGWGNNEHQQYTNEPKNVRIEDGHLIIEAHKEDYRGSRYTSSRPKTKNSWKYGRFEIKARLPQGRGTWAAIWGLPTDWTYGNWPKSGEIDIVEHVGYNEGHVVSSVHTERLSGNIGNSDQQNSITLEDACSEFYEYALEWDLESLQVFADDSLIFKFDKQDSDWVRWPFDQRFHFLMNIAVGGNWGGAQGIDDSIFPTRMEIDYIRVYQKN